METTDPEKQENGQSMADRLVDEAGEAASTIVGKAEGAASTKMQEIEGSLAGRIKDIPNSILVGGPAVFATAVPLVFDSVFRFFDLLPGDAEPPWNVIFTTFMFVYLLFPLLFILFKRFDVKRSKMLGAMAVFTLWSFFVSWVANVLFSWGDGYYFWEILILAVSLVVTIAFVLDDHLGWLRRKKTESPAAAQESSAAPRSPVQRDQVRTRFAVLYAFSLIAILGLFAIRSPQVFDGELNLGFSSYRMAFDEAPKLIDEADDFQKTIASDVSDFQDEIRLAAIEIDSVKLFPRSALTLLRQRVNTAERYQTSLKPLLDDSQLTEADRLDTLLARFGRLKSSLEHLDDSTTSVLKAREPNVRLIRFREQAREQQDEVISTLSLTNLRSVLTGLISFWQAERSRIILTRAQRNEEIRYLNMLGHHLDQRRDFYAKKYEYAQNLQYALFNSVQRPGLYIFGVTLIMLVIFYVRNLRRSKQFRDSHKERQMRWLQVKKGTLTKEEQDELKRLEREEERTAEEQDVLRRLQLKKRKLSDKEESTLKELEQKYNELEHERGTYYVGFALVAVLLIPLLQPFSKSDINVREPMKSFTSSNWYLPHLAKEAVNPLPTEEPSPLDLGDLSYEDIPGASRSSSSRSTTTTSEITSTTTTTGEPLADVQEVLDAVNVNQGLLERLLELQSSSGQTVGGIGRDLGEIRTQDLRRIMDELYRPAEGAENPDDQ